MADLKLNGVSKIYEDGFKAVHNINLDIDDKEFIVLVGPSGSGKSTALRMIAGLETISEGEMFIDGELVNNLPPKERDIAMVFQSYALYPHMTVEENLTFALKLRGVDKEESKKQAQKVAEILQITDLLDKKPGAMSGGQRQRVALGRAMVREPKVFLLDEPLSNLDAKLRVTMRAEIVRLHREIATTFVYVTHDQTEAMTMGTRIAVMNEGNIEQFDTPDNLYNNPANRFVAEFIGSPQMNLFNGQLVDTADGPALKTNGNYFLLPQIISERLLASASGQEIQFGVRPEDIEYAETEKERGAIDVNVNNVEQVGSDTFVYFDMPNAEGPCVARLSPPRIIPILSDVTLKVDLDKVFIFDSETGDSILDRQSNKMALV